MTQPNSKSGRFEVFSGIVTFYGTIALGTCLFFFAYYPLRNWFGLNTSVAAAGAAVGVIVAQLSASHKLVEAHANFFSAKLDDLRSDSDSLWERRIESIRDSLDRIA